MIRLIIKIGIDGITEIEGHHQRYEVSMDRIIEGDHIMSIIIEMILGETILETCKIIDIRILEVDIEGIIEMVTLEEVDVGLRKDSIQVILVEMAEVVIIGQDQVQEPVLTETELDALSVGNMIILLKPVQIHKQKKKSEQIQQMNNLDEEQTTLKVLATDMYDKFIRTYSDNLIGDHLNVLKVRMPPTFLPLNTKIGGPVKYITDKETVSLTKLKLKLTLFAIAPSSP